jgi:hypothetical protein
MSLRPIKIGSLKIQNYFESLSMSAALSLIRLILPLRLKAKNKARLWMMIADIFET